MIKPTGTEIIIAGRASPQAFTAAAAEPARFVVVDLDTLRAIVRDVVAEIQPGAAQPEFYSQACLPPGMTRRTFLDAIRRGELPARAAGKARLVSREDYRAYVASAPAARLGMRTQPDPANDVRAILRASQGK